MGRSVRVGGNFRRKYYLHNAGHVAQIDKDEPAVVASPEDPPGESNIPVHIP